MDPAPFNSKIQNNYSSTGGHSCLNKFKIIPERYLNAKHENIENQSVTNYKTFIIFNLTDELNFSIKKCFYKFSHVSVTHT